MFFLVVMWCLLFFMMQIQSTFVMWIFLELISLIVLYSMLLGKSGLQATTGILNYFLVQAVGGLLLLMSILLEYSLASNIYFFFSPCIISSVLIGMLSLSVKLSVFPYYYQIVFIFNLLDGRQCFLLSTYPKVLPIYLIALMAVDSLFFFILVLGAVSVLLGGYYSIYSTSVNELFSWSTISHSGWLLYSTLSGTFYFVLYLSIYSLLISMLWNKYRINLNNFFTSGGGMLLNNNSSNYLAVALLMLSGFAPFVGFFIKLLMLFWFLGYYNLAIAVLVLIITFSAVLFYSRIVQFFTSVNDNYNSSSRKFSDKVVGLTLSEVVILGVLLTMWSFLFV